MVLPELGAMMADPALHDQPLRRDAQMPLSMARISASADLALGFPNRMDSLTEQAIVHFLAVHD